MTEPNDTSAWMQIEPVTIADRKIGPREQTFVIAEAGVNHNGDLERAMEMVRVAAATGADAVKFQLFSAKALTSADAPSAAYQNAADQRRLLGGLELPDGAMEPLIEQGRRLGILVLATPFGPAEAERLGLLGLPAIKTAGPDLINRPLLEAVGRLRRPVIVSTGAADVIEIRQGLNWLKAAGATDIILLHCVSSYPTPLGEANLGCIAALAREFNCAVGFSDHTRDIVTAEVAVRAGACVLEKHFTLDRALEGPDHAMSMEPADLARYVRLARQSPRGLLDPEHVPAEWIKAMGDGIKRPLPIEAEVRRVARSSVVSTEAIAAGATLTRSMLTVKRPGGGVAPAEIDNLPGRVAKVDIPADTVITAEMLE